LYRWSIVNSHWHFILQTKARCLALFQFLSRESGLSAKQRAFIRKIKRPTNSLDNLIINQGATICQGF
jgi:hypothetical protein